MAQGLPGTPTGARFFGGVPFLLSLPRWLRLLLSGAFPTPPCASLRELAPLALPPPLDQGCLLLSTPNNTPITRARPPRRPISSLGNSTFPRGWGGDWLKRLSVRWASRKDAAGVLGTRSPEQRRSNLPHKQDPSPSPKEGVGEPKHYPAPGAPPEPGEQARRRVGESLPPPPALHCSCKHVSLHVCFPFCLTVAITDCCLQKSCKAPPGPVVHSLCLPAPFLVSSFFSLDSTERRGLGMQACFPFIAAHVGQVMLYRCAPFSRGSVFPVCIEPLG